MPHVSIPGLVTSGSLTGLQVIFFWKAEGPKGDLSIPGTMTGFDVEP